MNAPDKLPVRVQPAQRGGRGYIESLDVDLHGVASRSMPVLGAVVSADAENLLADAEVTVVDGVCDQEPVVSLHDDPATVPSLENSGHAVSPLSRSQAAPASPDAQDERPNTAADILITKPALRYHGAKFRLAPWIMKFFPPHRCYVEPFGGAAGVLLQKPRAYAEVYNDLDGDVVNFFRVLRDPASRQELIEACRLTPYARAEFEQAWQPVDEPVERARRIAIRAQMGFGSAGASKGITGFRIDTHRRYGTAQQHWADFPASLEATAARFAGVLIENRPAVDVMAQHDGEETLHFVDPPYMHHTRVRGCGKDRYYRHEMDDEAHVELLGEVCKMRGMVVLSGYRSDLYDLLLVGWRRHETTSRISAGRGTAIRTECVWINPHCAAALDRRQDLLL